MNQNNTTISKVLIYHGVSILTISLFGFLVFIEKTTFELTIQELYEISSYFFIVYLFSQGILFNLNKPNTISEAMTDIFMSILPLFLIFYVFVTNSAESHELKFLRNMYLLVALFDFLIFSWASLKLLLYTDKSVFTNTRD